MHKMQSGDSNPLHLPQLKVQSKSHDEADIPQATEVEGGWLEYT